MKKIVLINIFLSIHILSFSQIVGFEKKDTTKPFFIFKSLPYKKVVLGLEYELIYSMYKNQSTYEKNRASLQTFEPHLGFFPHKNLGLGLIGKIEFFKSNYLENNIPNVYEMGVFARYFFPFETNIKVFNRFSFSIGASLSKSNYTRRDDDIYFFTTDTSYVMYDNMSQNLIRLYGTSQFRIYKGLNIKMSWRYEIFTNKYRGFRPTIGIEYHFYEKKKKYNY